MNDSSTKRSLAYLFASLTILFWGTSASAFKIALRYLEPVPFLFFASWTAFLLLGIILLFQGRLSDVFKFSTRQYLYSLGLGFLNPFAYYVILFQAYDKLPAQIAQPLNFIWPITLVLLSIPILGQRLSLKSILALVVSFIGVFFISSQGKILNFEFADPLGVGLALGSSVIWALFWLFNIRDHRKEEEKLFLNFFTASLLISIMMLFYDKPQQYEWEGVAASVYVGVFEMGITFVLWLKALKLAGRTDKLSNLIYLTPFTALVFIHIILGEEIFYTTLIGLVLIVGGIIIQQRDQKKLLKKNA